MLSLRMDREKPLNKYRNCLDVFYNDSSLKDGELQSYLDIIDFYITHKFKKEDEYLYRKNFRVHCGDISIKSDNIYIAGTTISFINLLFADLDTPPSIRDFVLYDNIEDIKTTLKQTHNRE